MSPSLHKAKERLERRTGLHLVRTDAFPYLRAERRFLTVRMDLHNKCNIRCTMCYFSLDEVWNQPRVEMSDALLDRLEREVWPRTRELWLSCATEPLIGRKLGDALTRAKRAGVPSVCIVTNGLGLSEQRARTLLEGGLDRLCLSFDGATKATYERIRHGSNYERVLDNIRRMTALKAEMGLTHPRFDLLAVMMLENLKEWPALARLAADLGATSFTLIPQTYYKEFDERDSLWNHREETNASLGETARICAERGIEFDGPGVFNRPHASSDLSMPASAAGGDRACGHCYLPWMQIIVYPNGEMLPCSPMFAHRHFGNLNEQPFDGIFYGPRFAELREELRTGHYCDLCANCPAGHLKDLNDQAAFIPRAIFPAATS